MALMLMLVAMTYNPSLFLALVVGYFVGSYLFYTSPTIGTAEGSSKQGTGYSEHDCM
ncbi:copper transporter family protein [archaeon]|nr:MAG: copper transporter family protein [archaeon]